MKQQNQYRFTNPPKAISNAKLDNIALVPASLLFQKGRYQTIANNLPGKGVLICKMDKKERIITVLEAVAQFFRQNGHTVKTLSSSLFL